MSAIEDFLLGDIIWALIFWFLVFPFLMIAIVIYLVKLSRMMDQLIRVEKAKSQPLESQVPSYVPFAEQEAKKLA